MSSGLLASLARDRSSCARDLIELYSVYIPRSGKKDKNTLTAGGLLQPSLGVTLYVPILLGLITTPEGYHACCSEYEMFDVTNSKLL